MNLLLTSSFFALLVDQPDFVIVALNGSDGMVETLATLTLLSDDQNIN